MKRKILLGLSSIIAIAPVAIAAGCGKGGGDKTPTSDAGTSKLNDSWTSTKAFATLPLSLKTRSTRDIKDDYRDSTKSGYTDALVFKDVNDKYPTGFELKSVRVVSVKEDKDKTTNKTIYKVTYRVTVSSDTERGYKDVIVTYI